MELRLIITEDNPNPVFILSKFGRVVYANIPGMDILDYLNLNIGDKVHSSVWQIGKASHSNGIFMLEIKEINFKWISNTLHNGFIYLNALPVEESNLLFTRM
jgi:hypothetical protein